MEEPIGSLTTLIIGGCYLLLIVTRAALLVKYDCITFIICLGLVVRGEEELFEDLADEVLLLNDPVAYRLAAFSRQIEIAFR